MTDLFNTIIYEPLYNALIFLITVLPAADVGLAVILLTILVKLLLFPLSRKAIQTQVTIQRINPELERVKEEYKDDQQEQVKKILALYKENKINPLSGILTLLVQLPIIFGLYWIFWRGGLPQIDVDQLYSFITVPTEVNMFFLGVFDMGGKSIILALLAGITQFIHAKIAAIPPQTTDERSFKNDLAKSLHFQMRYIFPVIVFVIGYTISAAVALYWVTNNTFTIIQELIVRRKLSNKTDFVESDVPTNNTP